MKRGVAGLGGTGGGGGAVGSDALIGVYGFRRSVLCVSCSGNRSGVILMPMPCRGIRSGGR